MKTFDDLVFQANSGGLGGTQAVVNFDNGYGVSVITGFGAYGGDEGLYELAVLKDDHLCYDTEVTSDVEGFLTTEDVTRLMASVQELPARDDTKEEPAQPLTSANQNAEDSTSVAPAVQPAR